VAPPLFAAPMVALQFVARREAPLSAVPRGPLQFAVRQAMSRFAVRRLFTAVPTVIEPRSLPE